MLGKKKKSASVKRKPKKREVFVDAPYPHFRFYRKSGHPALILKEVNEGKDYLFRRTSHEDSVARKSGYEVLEKNPNPNDPKPMFIERRKRRDRKIAFYRIPLNWKYKKEKK